MKYLRTNVRIFKGTNSRGDYYWIMQDLFNDEHPEENPTRLPRKPTLLPLIVNAFLEHKDALKENEGGWLDVDMSKIPDEGNTNHHIDNLAEETVIFNDWYNRIYTRSSMGADGKMHEKDTLVVGKNGEPLPATNEISVMVQYSEKEVFEKGMKVKRWVPIEKPRDLANLLISRYYRKKVDINPTQVTFAGAEEDDDAPKSAEDKDAERAELERRLAELR